MGGVSVISGSEEVVAFEIMKASEQLFFSNFVPFALPSSVPFDGVSIYAVQADEKRIEVKPK